MARKRSGDEPESHEGRFAYDGLDRVIHEKARLGILASLAANDEGLSFSDLKQLCALTDGNLSRHLTVLADAGLVKVRKTQAGARARTTYRLTSGGRRRFVAYIDVLERVVSDAQVEGRADRPTETGTSTRWSPSPRT